MLVYANGCSMTYGAELVDDIDQDPALQRYREDHSWPARLGDFLDADRVVNDAVISGSNDRIVRTTIDWLAEHGETAENGHLLVVIGWSGAMRREFYVDGEFRQVIPYQPQQHPDVQKLTDVYREVAWNDRECGARLSTQLLSLQSFLSLHRIPYLFFDAIESSFDTLGRAGLAERGGTRMVDRSRFYRFGDADGSMADVLRASGTGWKGRHPAEDGHETWAHKLAAHIVSGQLLRRPTAAPPTAPTGPAFTRRRAFRPANRDFLYP
ncbi:DUF6071 family protein [Streptomyces sp. NPDC091292]|uniref:DUF6071 family protein n=1 Tax=Streptomyces sp. NPDC091292 TaxID=3365991 RepID=UPI00381854EC